MKAQNSGSGMTSSKVLIVRPNGPAAFGMTPAERLVRLSERARLTMASAAGDADVIIRGDHVYGANLFDALVGSAPGTVLTDDAGRALAARVDATSRDWAARLLDTETPSNDLPSGGAAINAATLAGNHNAQLRKKRPPLLIPATDHRTIEKALFADSYKGVTDLVTKHVWPYLARPATSWCAIRRITPNQVTLVSAVLVGVTVWLFWHGYFGLGLATAWAMTLLDTIDGKLARVTLQSSPWGGAFDHGIDLIHPPFWYWAWAVGCAASGMPLNDGGWTLGVIVAGYILQRCEEGLFLVLFGMDMHVWRRFDSLFRQITARRNPNLLILMIATLLGAPREGMIAVAIWTVACFLIHLVRIGQAFIARRAGPLSSWLAEA
ncbi:MAG TPA: CDP-alcohol phosphatidyltransferase family protein [Thermohalobaculum sp.]|nr:CDP-alcohol phosphatidyltransferase family protein [Thermohalobaculum sp.]